MTLLFLHGGLAAYALSTVLGILAVRRNDRRLLQGARTAAVVAVLAHAALIVIRGLGEGRFPVDNLHDAFLFLATGLALGALILDTWRGMPVLTLGAVPVATAAVLLAAGLQSGGTAPPGFWIDAHVLATLAAFCSFALGFVAAVLFLLERQQLKSHARSALLGFMPSLEGLYRIVFRSVWVGVVLLTAGILMGYLYARSLPQTGNEWRMDPKVLMTTATWLAYVIVLTMGLVPSCRGRRTAIGAAVCFVFVAATLWVGIFWSDFHKFL